MKRHALKNSCAGWRYAFKSFLLQGKGIFLKMLLCRGKTCRGTRWTATTWPPFSPRTSSTRWSLAMGRYHQVITKHGQISPNIIKHCQLYLVTIKPAWWQNIEMIKTICSNNFYSMKPQLLYMLKKYLQYHMQLKLFGKNLLKIPST